MKRVTVFCGASDGLENLYKQQAYHVGKTLAERNIGIVYGGANIGLMGAVADGALHHNGVVIGVLPHFLKSKEVEHNSLTELILVNTMHERKAMMNTLSSGIITLPGGFGTMEELFEMLTWAQLDLHKKPIGILNTDGFYDDLLSLVDRMIEKGFLQEDNKRFFKVSGDINALLQEMNLV